MALYNWEDLHEDEVTGVRSESQVCFISVLKEQNTLMNHL